MSEAGIGKFLGRKKVSFDRPWPNTAVYEAVYESDEVVAVCYKDNKEISRDVLKTTKIIQIMQLGHTKATHWQLFAPVTRQAN